jgi:hypothetical protein
MLATRSTTRANGAAPGADILQDIRVPQEKTRPNETSEERKQRWAAEAAATKPRSRVLEFVEEHSARVLGTLVIAGFFGAIGFVALSVAHRGDPGSHTLVGLISPGTCFPTAPLANDNGEVGAIATVDCSQPHLAEAYVALPATNATQDQVARHCVPAWARQSDVAPSASGLRLTSLIEEQQEQQGETVTDVLCIVIAPLPVKGFELAHWKPSDGSAAA